MPRPTKNPPDAETLRKIEEKRERANKEFKATVAHRHETIVDLCKKLGQGEGFKFNDEGVRFQDQLYKLAIHDGVCAKLATKHLGSFLEEMEEKYNQEDYYTNYSWYRVLEMKVDISCEYPQSEVGWKETLHSIAFYANSHHSGDDVEYNTSVLQARISYVPKHLRGNLVENLDGLIKEYAKPQVPVKPPVDQSTHSSSITKKL